MYTYIILRSFHLSLFASFDRPYALEIKYPMRVRAISFHIRIYKPQSVRF